MSETNDHVIFQLPYRTEAQCRIRWLVSDHPRINQTPWTQEEDTKLIDVAREHKNRNWEKIAQEMGVSIAFLSV